MVSGVRSGSLACTLKDVRPGNTARTSLGAFVKTGFKFVGGAGDGEVGVAGDAGVEGEGVVLAPSPPMILILIVNDAGMPAAGFSVKRHSVGETVSRVVMMM